MLRFKETLAYILSLTIMLSILVTGSVYAAAFIMPDQGAAVLSPEADSNDSGKPARRYPVSDEAYYVLSCLAINGNDSVSLQKCSCAMSALEGRLSYDQYKDAEMVLALRQAGGRNAAIFRDTSSMRDIVKVFTEAQQAANGQCFGEKAASRGNDAAGK